MTTGIQGSSDPDFEAYSYPWFWFNCIVGLLILRLILEVIVKAACKLNHVKDLRLFVRNILGLASHMCVLVLCMTQFTGINGATVRLSAFVTCTIYVMEWFYLVRLDIIQFIIQLITVLLVQLLQLTSGYIHDDVYAPLCWVMLFGASCDFLLYLSSLINSVRWYIVHMTGTILYAVLRLVVFVWGWGLYIALTEDASESIWHKFWLGFFPVVYFVLLLFVITRSFRLIYGIEFVDPDLGPEYEYTQAVENQHPCDQPTTGLLNRTMLYWISGLLDKDTDIQPDDVWNLPSTDMASNVYARFNIAWQRQINRYNLHKARERGRPLLDNPYNSLNSSGGHNDRNNTNSRNDNDFYDDAGYDGQPPSLFTALREAFGYHFWGIGSSQLIFAVVISAQPVCFKYLVSAIASDEANMTTFSLAIGIFLSMAVAAVATGQGYSRCNLLGSNCRSALISAVYAKSFKLGGAIQDSNAPRLHQLVGADSQRVWMMCFFGGMLSRYLPVLIFILAILLWEIGWIAMICMLVTFVIIALVAILGLVIHKYRGEMLQESDKRLSLLGDILDNIHVIKSMGWGQVYFEKLAAIRESELVFMWRLYTLRAVNFSTLNFGPYLIYTVGLSIYAVTDDLSSSVVYSVVLAVSVLAPCLYLLPRITTALAEGMVALQRFEEFLLLPERSTRRLGAVHSTHAQRTRPTYLDDEADEKHAAGLPNNNDDRNDNNNDDETDCSITVEDGVFQWHPYNEESNQDENKLGGEIDERPQLTNVNVRIRSGQLVCIIGPPGCGKTSLIRACLGELLQIRGTRSQTGPVAYAGPDPWIVDGTIRYNVVMGMPFKPKIYKRVLEVSGLMGILRRHGDGDRTRINSSSTNLAGVGHMCLNLARCYYRAMVLNRALCVVDVPLRDVAVPSKNNASAFLWNPEICNNSASSVMDFSLYDETDEKGVGMPGGTADQASLQECTRVVVCGHEDVKLLQHADNVIVVDDMTIIEQGSYAELKDNPALSRYLDPLELKQDQGDEYDHEERDTLPMVYRELQHGNANNVASLQEPDPRSVNSLANLTEEEEDDPNDSRLHGEVVHRGVINSQLVKFYLGDSWCTIAGIVSFFLLSQSSCIISDLILTHMTTIEEDSGDLDITLWVGLYFLFMFLIIIFSLIKAFYYFATVWTTAKDLHNNALDKIINAPIDSFHRTTATGVIVNRFSKDLDSVDLILPDSLSFIAFLFVYAIGVIILMTYYVPYCLLALLPVVVYFAYYQRKLAYSSREIKRFESESRASMLQIVEDTIDGMANIRASQMQSHYQKELAHSIDRNASFLYHVNQILCYTAIILSLVALVVVIVVVIVLIFTETEVSVSEAALVMVYSFTLMGILPDLVFLTLDLENYLTQLERVQDLVNIPVEQDQGDQEPPANWPNEGRIEFRNVNLSYSSNDRNHDLPAPLALKNISFSVAPGQHTTVMGLPGSGKSSLASALVRFGTVTRGAIFIDEVNIANLKLETLRKNVTIIYESPSVFLGTIRSNIDPTGTMPDRDVWRALHTVGMSDAVRQMPAGIHTEVLSKGANLNRICKVQLSLARSLSRQSKVVFVEDLARTVHGLDVSFHNLQEEKGKQQSKGVRQALNSLTRTFKKSFASSFEVTYDFGRALEGDQLMIIRDGGLLEYGTPYDLLMAGLNDDHDKDSSSVIDLSVAGAGGPDAVPASPSSTKRSTSASSVRSNLSPTELEGTFHQMAKKSGHLERLKRWVHRKKKKQQGR